MADRWHCTCGRFLPNAKGVGRQIITCRGCTMQFETYVKPTSVEQVLATGDPLAILDEIRRQMWSRRSLWSDEE